MGSSFGEASSWDLFEIWYVRRVAFNFAGWNTQPYHASKLLLIPLSKIVFKNSFQLILKVKFCFGAQKQSFVSKLKYKK